ncbi:hypothetical protein P4O66_011987, partial [Electrophorus voltai]
VLFDMQQKLCTRNTTLFVENGQACGAGVSAQLQFQCPRCSERDSFHSMAALLAHLEYSHASPAGHDLSLPASRGRSHSDRREAHKRATAETRTIKDVCSDTHSSRRGEHELLFSSEPLPPERPAGQQLERPRSPEESPGNKAAPAGSRSLSAPVASVGQRLEGMMRTANSSMERHLLRISSALAQTDTALLCERAHWHHLAQERQEVLQRERALSRQVDAAVMVIATLRQQLSVSEHELKRREQHLLQLSLAHTELPKAGPQESSFSVRKGKRRDLGPGGRRPEPRRGGRAIRAGSSAGETVGSSLSAVSVWNGVRLAVPRGPGLSKYGMVC